MPVEGDTVAAIGENRKMLIFPLDEVNEMARGKGVILQRYKDGGLSDVRVFRKDEGLTWLDPAGRTFTLPMSELKDWVGQRAQSGRLAPSGFPKVQQIRPRILSPFATVRITCTLRASGPWVGRCGGGGLDAAGVVLVVAGCCGAGIAGSRRRARPGRSAARATSRWWSTRRPARCASLTQQNTPQFQAKLRQLKDKRAWSNDQFMKEAEPFVRDDTIAGFDQKSEEFLARITSGGQSRRRTAPRDCALLAGAARRHGVAGRHAERQVGLHVRQDRGRAAQVTTANGSVRGRHPREGGDLEGDQTPCLSGGEK